MDSKLTICQEKQAGRFPLVDGAAAGIWVAEEDFKVVHIAAGDLAADIERVTGVRPVVWGKGVRPREEKGSDPFFNGGLENPPSLMVIVGTLGHSPLIDGLCKECKLDCSGIAGKWECFLTTVITDPVPGVKMALVIAGSDRRGTAFGIYDLSEAIGVSPWYWWADVPAKKSKTLFVKPGVVRQGPPSVKYRGIFINDEDWGLQPWAAKTFEPEVGDMGPRTYAKMFELMLRLKANHVWPAMHPSTKAFNMYPQNKQVAEDYAIVMGSSHCEPMLRNNVTEWDEKARGEWNYQTNRDGVLEYWDQRARENGKFENVYTIGMRGIHDGRMPGTGTVEEKVKLLEQIFTDQRGLLSKHVDKDASKVPQLFCAYKEVLELYQNGLKVPEDVTLGWADDNFGYIRQLCTPDEQKRAGGSGVYYHVSYWGRPHDYLWLTTTPPALIWEEMSKAYDYGARTVWILNVGDLKAAEIPTEFFLRLAWDVNAFHQESASVFLETWAAREFGPESATWVSLVMRSYYELGFARKPEHMGWNGYFDPAKRTEFSPVSYGDEAANRLDAYRATRRVAEDIYGNLPTELKDAYYQLVLYPVRCAELMNQKFLYTDRSYLHKFQGRASTNLYAKKAKEAYDRIQKETETYNTQVAGGKWNHVISPAPRDLAVFKMPETAQLDPQHKGALGVAVEGHLRNLADPTAELDPTLAHWAKDGDANPDLLPEFSVLTGERHFFDVFNMGRRKVAWSASVSHPWIWLSERGGSLGQDTRVWVGIDWEQAPEGENIAGSITVHGGEASYTIRLSVFNPAVPLLVDFTGLVESDGVVAMDAESFTRHVDTPSARWQVLWNLGRAQNCITVLPTTAPSIEDAAKSPCLEYDFQSFTTGLAKVRLAALPTHRIHLGRGLRFAIAFDDCQPVVVDIDAGRDWSDGVLRNATWTCTELALTKPGLHTLKLWMVDPGVVLDRIVIDFGGLRPSYLGPPETRQMPLE